MKGVEALSLTSTTTGTGIAFAVPVTDQNIVACVRGVGTISGGTVLIEEADVPSYSGSWSLLATCTASAITATAQQVFHIAAMVKAVRARVSSNITGGGTLSVGFTCG